MNDLSEWGKILAVGEKLLDQDLSADALCSRAGVSVATLKRYLAELRHVGCQIVSRREPSGWVYRLENAEAVRVILLRWLDLERRRTLVTQ